MNGCHYSITPFKYVLLRGMDSWCDPLSTPPPTNPPTHQLPKLFSSIEMFKLSTANTTKRYVSAENISFDGGGVDPLLSAAGELELCP